jgi:transcriptional regulator with XRE-family HTH domain
MRRAGRVDNHRVSTPPPRLLATVDLSELGRRLRHARTQRGLTQKQLAGSDVSIAYVSRIEAGQRRPELRVLTRMARRLGMPVEQLLTGMNDVQAEEVTLSLRYAELALMSGDAAAAEVELDKVIAMLPDATSTWQHRRARWLLARAVEAQGRLDDAIRLLEDLVAAPDESSLAAYIVLCRCYREAGDLGRSIDIGESALALLAPSELPGSDEEVQLTVTLAAAYFERGDAAYATKLCADALARAERLGSPTARASAYWNASIIQSRRGASGEAVRLAERALALLGEGDETRNLARLRTELGVMLLRQPQPQVDVAEQHLVRARDELLATDSSALDVGRCDLQLARICLLRGDVDGAEQLATAVHEAAHEWPLVAADADAVLGRVAAARAAVDEARTLFRRAVATLSAAQADRDVAQLWYELGALLDGVGDAATARDAYRSAAASLGLQTPEELLVTV